MPNSVFINPEITSFEAELGLLCEKWIDAQGLDHVIEGLDDIIVALEDRRDVIPSQALPK